VAVEGSCGPRGYWRDAGQIEGKCCKLYWSSPLSIVADTGDSGEECYVKRIRVDDFTDPNFGEKMSGQTCYETSRKMGGVNLGSSLSLQECGTQCLQSEECKWFGWHAMTGECTSFSACGRVRSMADSWQTYKKLSSTQATPMPPDVSHLYGELKGYCGKPDGRPCDLGYVRTVEECKIKCAEIEDCKAISHLSNAIYQTDGGCCTSWSSFPSCNPSSSSLSRVTYAKLAGSTPSPTFSPGSLFGEKIADTRCNTRYRNGKWGDLGRKLTLKECQDACVASTTCKFIGFRKGQCTSYKACEGSFSKMQAMKPGQGWETYEKRSA